MHYQYGPAVFNVAPEPRLAELDVLYVVGGLYGSELALQEVLRLFEQEKGRKQLVFNGDFHWFDVDPNVFERVQRQVLSHIALGGNVETELSDEDPDIGAGCGCAYPDWVGEEVVARSNRILNRLRSATTTSQRRALALLPMWAVASVGDKRIGLVHGDAQSLAGWGFAQEHLRNQAHLGVVRGWLHRANVDAFASSHTCLPVFQKITVSTKPGACWILNNGAAGMPNFNGDRAGLLTRIATQPFAGPERRFGVRQDNVFMDGLAVELDQNEAQRRFLSQWPPGSDAHASYFSRLIGGPDYAPGDVIRLES